MARRSVCAIVTALNGDLRASAMLAAACEDIGGSFEKVCVVERSGAQEAAASRNAGVAEAHRLGADWILFLEPGDALASHAFEMAAPALHAYDAVWGSVVIVSPSGEHEIPRQTRFACQDEIGAFHMALHWWVGRSHFVRTRAVRAEPFRAMARDAWFADYLERQWRRHRCVKTCQPYTTAQSLAPLENADRVWLLNRLAERPRMMAFEHAGHAIRLPYSGRNPTLERVQLGGRFYEQDELAHLARAVKPGAVIVDVGANTGNHTLYFASVMRAAKVIAIEPNPQACRMLRCTVAENRLETVDLSRLGIAAGKARAHGALIAGGQGHLGTTRFALNGEKELPVAPIDTLICEDIDLLKIDVEGMELEVLEGARGLIERCRPRIMIEVRDGQLAPFMQWLEDLRYDVDGVYADFGYANYVLVPRRQDNVA
jgi:FkbM family methyltransferase